MKIILLIMIGLSMLNADFTKSGDIVTDSALGLQWQDDAVGSSMLWEAAIAHCEELTLGGFSDWRLPNINELQSIVDSGKVNPVIVDDFEYTSSNFYWSSTTYDRFKDYAWGVNFYGGYVRSNNKGNNYYVRCVRGSDTGSPGNDTSTPGEETGGDVGGGGGEPTTNDDDFTGR